MTNATWEIVVTFTSDWTVGTGAGIAGLADSRLLRDDDGFPFLPARTLRGIWRDACESIAGALGPLLPDGRRIIEAVFGVQADDASPSALHRREGALWLTEARLHPDVRKAIAAVPGTEGAALRDDLTHIEMRCAIDPETGGSAADKLFAVELGRPGLAFVGRWGLDGVADDVDADRARGLLAAGARWIRRLGGDRRRGKGRCAWRLDGGPFASDFDALRGSLLAEEVTP